MTNDLANRVAELHFAAELPAVVRRQLVEGAAVIDLKAGDTLFQEGSSASECYLILQGQVSLRMQTTDKNQSLPILDLETGDFVGFSPLLGDGHMTCEAVATIPTRLMVIPAEHVFQICQQDPAAGLQIMTSVARAIAKRLVKTRQQLLELFSQQNL